MAERGWTGTNKTPVNKLTRSQWNVVVAMKNGVELCVENTEAGTQKPFYSDNRKAPTMRTVLKLVQMGWLKPVVNELGGIQNYELT